MLSTISNVNKGVIVSNIFKANIFSSSQSIRRLGCYKTTIDNVTASGYLYQSFLLTFLEDIKDNIIYLIISKAIFSAVTTFQKAEDTRNCLINFHFSVT